MMTLRFIYFISYPENSSDKDLHRLGQLSNSEFNRSIPV